MRYEKLLHHVTSDKIKRTSRWRGLTVNDKTGAIFPASRYGMEQAKKEKRPYDENCVSFFFQPGDICVLNHVPLGMWDLAPYGIPGKFEARKSPKSEFTFVHELFDKYESFPGMELDMRGGKPLTARLLDDIEYNTERLKEFEKRVREIKHVLFTVNRMNDKEPDFQGTRYCFSENDVEKRRALFVKLLSKPLDKTNNWVTKLMPYYSAFYYTAKMYYDPGKKPDYNKVFDNMLRFDKAALFRELKVVE